MTFREGNVFSRVCLSFCSQGGVGWGSHMAITHKAITQGNVFTLVCHSVHRGRGSSPPHPLADLVVGQTPPYAHPQCRLPLGWADPPWKQTPSGWVDPPSPPNADPPPGLGRSPSGWADPPVPTDADPPGVGHTPPRCRPPLDADPLRLGRSPLSPRPPDADPPPRVGQTPLHPPQIQTPPRCRPPPPITLNKRAMRILLECILV